MRHIAIFILLGVTPVFGDEIEAPEIAVKAKAVKVHDEVTYAPHSVSIEQPASDVYLGETLSKLPGVLVRNVSGFGSTTTVITSSALGSASTAVSIDDIPILDPSGRGINFSIFPSALLSSVEHHSPFYPSINPSADTLPAPGGRINLRTLSAPKKGERPYLASLLIGTARTVELTGAYRGGKEREQWLAGVSGFNTAGDFHYTNPRNGNNENRLNNNAAGVGGLAKYGYKLRGGGTVEVLDLISHQDRTNPGSIDRPTRDHQRDMFNLLGVRYNNPTAISAKNGLFAKAAGAYTRTATRVPVEFPGAADSTDSRGWAHYTQLGFNHRTKHTSYTLAADNQFDYVHKDEGTFNKDVFGATATGSVAFFDDQLKFLPLVRQDVSNRFADSTDAGASVIYSPNLDNDITLSYGLQHIYPALTAKSGFNLSGLVVLPNNNLKVQRDSIVSLGLVRRHSMYTLYTSGFYDFVRNRTTFTAAPTPGQFQFVNSSAVSVFGYMLDGQVFPTQSLSLRVSATLQRAWDRGTGHEMPYKPRFEGYSSVGYLFTQSFGTTLEEQIVGKRFTSTTGVDAMSPFLQTNVRFDLALLGGTLFFKVSNVFNEGAFENPGYPFAGRSYWLGYTL